MIVVVKSNQPISLKLVVIGPTREKDRLTFGGDPIPGIIPDHFSTSLSIVEWGILGDSPY